jgi:hypothetical protein
MKHGFLLTAAAAVIYGCGSDAGSGADSARSPAANQAPAMPAQQIAPARPAAASAASASCDLIPSPEIERIAGPLAGEPVPEDRGCWYYVVVDTTTAEWQRLREGADRARASGMDERAIAMYHPMCAARGRRRMKDRRTLRPGGTKPEPRAAGRCSTVAPVTCAYRSRSGS